jgi:D-3-phosphoglycerate dehydrogenase
MKVLIPQPIASAGTTFLQEHGYETICPDVLSTAYLQKAITNCEAVLLRTAIIDRDLLTAGKTLRIVARHGAGFDNVDIQAAAELGIWVTNAPLSTTCSVAEFTLTAILMLAKRIPFFMDSFTRGDFSVRMRQSGVELENKILGIIGLGRIGREVAKKASAGLGMRIAAYDPFLSPDAEVKGVTLFKELKGMLKEADFVTLHMPNTEQTRKMMNNAQFAVMKPGAYFINAARGEVLDEAALAKALEEGKIAGAAVDVYDPEPPTPDNPLLKAPNLIATPHIASNTVEANIKMALHAAQEIHRVLSGEHPQWPVNKPLNPRMQQ